MLGHKCWIESPLSCPLPEILSSICNSLEKPLPIRCANHRYLVNEHALGSAERDIRPAVLAIPPSCTRNTLLTSFSVFIQYLFSSTFESHNVCESHQLSLL